MMSIGLPDNASEVFNRSCSFNVDNSAILAYSLAEVTSKSLNKICDRATESYARNVLNWPNGRLAKPNIFAAASQVELKDVEQCAKHFVQHLHTLYQSEPCKELPIYPFAFIVISKADLPENAIAVLAYQENEVWRLGKRLIPIETRLGLSLESLRMGDISQQDIMNEFRGTEPRIPQERADEPPTKDKRVFAVFSTGLKSALPMPALIDPTTDKVQPSETTLDLIADPENSHFYMSRQRMLELFPIICRDDERRGWRTKGRKLHKNVFICCDNDNPEQKGVVVISMDWDGETDQNNETLKKVGSEAPLTEIRVGVKEALLKAREVADEV